jgi:hypothetical protein
MLFPPFFCRLLLHRIGLNRTDGTRRLAPAPGLIDAFRTSARIDNVPFVSGQIDGVVRTPA